MLFYAVKKKALEAGVMARIYVSGLVNTETTVKVRKFPVDYYPIDYPFFGVQTQVSGVAYNVAKALCTLGDEVYLASILGRDIQADVVERTLQKDGIGLEGIRRDLEQTPSSVVLYDDSGRRQIYCDLKDIQEREYVWDEERINRCDLIAACNIGFNRSLLHKAKATGKRIATDVHVLSDVEDEYNREFLENANIVFLSDEGLPCDPGEFLWQLHCRYHNDILVLGRGEKGAMLYDQQEDRFCDLPCVPANVVNTVGAGDALFSAFLHFYGKGMKPIDALWRAQVFASAKTECNGASLGFLTEGELERRWNNMT